MALFSTSKTECPIVYGDVLILIGSPNFWRNISNSIGVISGRFPFPFPLLLISPALRINFVTSFFSMPYMTPICFRVNINLG